MRSLALSRAAIAARVLGATLALAAVALPVAAEEEPPPAPPAPARAPLAVLDDVISRALSTKELRGTDVGVLIETLDGRALYERDADLPLLPASNMKIVTGACALELFGPAHVFATEMAVDGTLEDGVLDGDLVVRGSGDPSIVLEEMWRLADEIRARGVARVTGDLVLDASRFDSVTVCSPEAEEGDRAYDARTCALSFNFNAVAVRVMPGSRAGERPLVTLSPDVGFVDVDNHAATCAAGRRPTIEIRRAWRDDRNVVTVTGRIPERSDGISAYRNVDDPLGYFGAALLDDLARAGVVVEGRARGGARPR
jgi:D-alanyl-D-alanine carboxypeptidase/D-alanyl-D-alanine-endopeptidase (penicillin-binding protein 4)